MPVATDLSADLSILAAFCDGKTIRPFWGIVSGLCGP